MSGHRQVRLTDKLQFLKVAHVVKAERLQREHEYRERDEAERRQRAEEERRKKEEARRNDLIKEAETWRLPHQQPDSAIYRRAPATFARVGMR